MDARLRGHDGKEAGLRMNRWPLILALSMLLSAWGTLQSLSQGEAVLTKRPFAEFPLTIAERWKGRELGLPAPVLDVLKLSDYMMRGYVPAAQARGKGERTEVRGKTGQDTAPLYLYVGYYESQRTGATYHSPKNCLPGAGWEFIESKQVSVPMPDRGVITINRALVRKGLDEQVILYWYQDRGRVIASEYRAKAYLIWDAMTKNRTDGSLVRISVPVTTTADQAYEYGQAFLQGIWPLLSEYMPTA